MNLQTITSLSKVKSTWMISSFTMKLFLLKNFNKKFLHLHDSKCILIENLAMHSRYPKKSLVSECWLVYQRLSFQKIIKHETYIPCITFTLIYHKLSNSNEKISQNSMMDISISDHQLIYLTWKPYTVKLNTHKYAHTKKIFKKLHTQVFKDAINPYKCLLKNANVSFKTTND